MSNGVFQVPFPENEPVKGYAPGSIEKAELLADIYIPLFLGFYYFSLNNF